MNLFYFAYGSNIHPARLRSRIGSAKLITTCSLEHHKLCFHKRSEDGSAKCSILHTGNPDDKVFGVLYELDKKNLIVLDKYESLNCGYLHKDITISAFGSSLNALTYVAMKEYVDPELNPYDWYKEMVIAGLLYYQFDVSYIERIRRMAALEDPNPVRTQQNRRILKKMEEFAKFRLKKRA